MNPMEDDQEKQESSEQAKKALLLGLGFDGRDGQKRVTVGRNFLLAGGSKPTHELMQEKAIKFNEELDRRKKRIEDVGPDEFKDIAERIDLNEKP